LVRRLMFHRRSSRPRHHQTRNPSIDRTCVPALPASQGPKTGTLHKSSVKRRHLLRHVKRLLKCDQDSSRLAQDYITTAQDYLLTAQVKTASAQVRDWKWNLVRSRLVYEFGGVRRYLHRHDVIRSSARLIAYLLIVENR
jgi:hypothetical protein